MTESHPVTKSVDFFFHFHCHLYSSVIGTSLHLESLPSLKDVQSSLSICRELVPEAPIDAEI